MSEIQTVFAKRQNDLRRLKGWEQPEVGKLVSTSGTVVGRHAHGEMTPSIEAAK